jgi:hypothetical protein
MRDSGVKDELCGAALPARALEPDVDACRRCGSEVVSKSRARLVLVGVLMIGALCVGPLWAPLWGPATLSAATGAYLLLWATLGRGRWCRTCKRFDRV